MWVGERGVRTLGAAFLWSTDTVIECTARWTLYSRGGRCVCGWVRGAKNIRSCLSLEYRHSDRVHCTMDTV